MLCKYLLPFTFQPLVRAGGSFLTTSDDSAAVRD